MTYQRNVHSNELEKEFNRLSILEAVEISETLTLFPIIKEPNHSSLNGLLTLTCSFVIISLLQKCKTYNCVLGFKPCLSDIL